MRVEYPLTPQRRARFLAKSEKAMQRRMRARNKAEKELSACWWATWMVALGIRPFEG